MGRGIQLKWECRGMRISCVFGEVAGMILYHWSRVNWGSGWPCIWKRQLTLYLLYGFKTPFMNKWVFLTLPAVFRASNLIWTIVIDSPVSFFLVFSQASSKLILTGYLLCTEYPYSIDQYNTHFLQEFRSSGPRNSLYTSCFGEH